MDRLYEHILPTGLADITTPIRLIFCNFYRINITKYQPYWDGDIRKPSW